MLVGMTLVLIVLIFFPGQLPRGDHRRADHSAQPALRIHSSARARRARESAFHRRDRFRNHHRRHRGDDGKHLPRTGRARTGQEYKLHEVIVAAARDVDRPIFYSVAVILAGYLPIYALSGPSGKLFRSHGRDHVLRAAGLADFHAHPGARAGLLLVQERRQRSREQAVRMGQGRLRRRAGLVPGSSEDHHDRRDPDLRRLAAA